MGFESLKILNLGKERVKGQAIKLGANGIYGCGIERGAISPIIL